MQDPLIALKEAIEAAEKAFTNAGRHTDTGVLAYSAYLLLRQAEEVERRLQVRPDYIGA